MSATGSAEPFILNLPCGAGYSCVDQLDGATCVPSGACNPGVSECRGDTHASCVDGVWQETACGFGCNSTPIGASCRPTASTTTYSSTLTYEYRAVNAGFTDWGTDVYTRPARRFLVVSIADGAVLDATVTDDDGRFSIEAVPAYLEDGDDLIGAFALNVDDSGDYAYAIVKSAASPGTVPVEQVAGGVENADIWFWSWTSTAVPAEGGVYIPLTSGSGAAFVYNYLSAIHDVAEAIFGARAGTSLVIWLDYGVSWDCGACFLDAPTRAFSSSWSSQAFISANADEGFWSGAVLAHELGHWLMATYGVSPGEGGQHILGVPTHPGIAWSEGFATWFSAVARQEPFYYDKQNGSFFWVDFDTRSYSGGVPWQRPEPDYGLEQLLDENEVARMLLGLTTQQNATSLLTTITSGRMTTPPYLRGYTRRTWDGLNEYGYPLPAWSTEQSAPHVADFFDALICGGTVTAADVDAQTEPWVHYPYPSAAPLCLSGEPPFQVSWRAPDDATLAEVRWYVPLSEDLVLSFVPAVGAPAVVPAGTGPGELALVFPGGGAGGSLAASPARPDGLDVRGAGAGWHF
ncbi:MAG: hypothetical protein EP329_01045, partial [Deltaproteobacteria bacterium]